MLKGGMHEAGSDAMSWHYLSVYKVSQKCNNKGIRMIKHLLFLE